MNRAEFMPDMYWDDSPRCCTLRCGAQGVQVAYMVPSKGGKRWEGFSDLPGNTILSERYKPKEEMRQQLAALTRVWFQAMFQDRPRVDNETSA